MAEKKQDVEVVPREQKATPIEAVEPIEVPAIMGATFAERAASREKADRKQVSGDDAENKAVTPSESKTRRTRKG